MAVTLFSTATEYLANEVTLTRGDVSDITGVGVFHSAVAGATPDVEDFTMVYLVDDPDTDPLAEGSKIDVLSLVGPKAGSDLTLSAGTYQRWVLVQTSTENIIRSIDIVTVLA